MKRILSMLLAVMMVLSLAACKQEAEPDPSGEPIGLTSDFTLEYTLEDDDFYRDLMGVGAKTAIMTVDGETFVDAATFSYWYAYYLNNFASGMKEYGQEEVDWDADWEDGLTIGEAMKEYAGTAASYYGMILRLADEYGLELPEEKIQECAQERDENIRMVGQSIWDQALNNGYIIESKYSDEDKADWIWKQGSENYATQIANVGSSDTGYNNILIKTALYDYVIEQLYKEGGPEAPSQEDLDNYLEERELVNVKFIYLSSFDQNYNEQDQSKKAQELSDEIQNSDNPKAKFFELLESNSEADFSGYPNGYLASITDFTTSTMSILKEMEPDTISEVVKDDYGWYIFLRLDPNYDDVRTRYMTDKANDLLNERLDSITIEKTPAYENLNSKDFFEKITELGVSYVGLTPDDPSMVKNSAAPEESGEPDSSSIPEPTQEPSDSDTEVNGNTGG